MEQEMNLINNNLILTKEQNNVYNKLIEFIKSENERELLLIGYAGTGKTTLVTNFINNIITNNLCKKIVIAAPTHKAVNIAKSKLLGEHNLNNHLLKNVNIMTIHRLLNYQSYINLEGEKYFAKGKIDPIWNIYNLIVIDECSMLSNQIISDIKNQMKNNINCNVKLIYVGDPAQLPPVNQIDSNIFTSKIKTLELDKIIRTNNQKIMDLSNDHRKWIFSKNINDVPHVGEYISEKINIFSHEDESIIWLNNFIKILKNDLNENIINDDENIIDNYNNNIILTWTNKKCNKYNQYIREKIFNKKELDYYEIGEILIFNDFHRIELEENKNEEIEEYNEQINKYVSFYTSEQIKLINIEKIKYKFEKIKFKINNNLTKKLNEKFKKNINIINNLIDIEINIYKLHINKISDILKKYNPLQEYKILTIDPSSEKIYYNLNEEFEKIIIILKNDCYKNIKKLDKIDNMKKCNLQGEVEKKINKLYKDWQTNVIDSIASLNYGYSITVHKSQGSTFKNVFIDIYDILENKNINETSKCLYTAITRSSDTLNLLI